MPTPTLAPWQLRAAFARRLSDLYGREVPAYTTLLKVTREVNDLVAARDPERAARLGSLERVSAERHGAIRVGTPRELHEVARVFGAMGMYPVGFYDLRDAPGGPVPVVSTAFRPTDPAELARNPFRVFTSLLATGDGRFFGPALRARLEAFLARRRLFPPELLDLADRAEREGGLPEPAAERFLTLAAASFALSAEPVDRAWYAELERVSGVAADIGGVTTTHINHLTPRVLDIDELYRRMAAEGIAMIDEIQGPPRWDGPDVLLRQTSFRALDEPRCFREPDGTLTTGALRVRFGEVEARGIALTRSGRALYDDLVARTDQRLDRPGAPSRQEAARALWTGRFPSSERQLALSGHAFFTYAAAEDRPLDGRRPPADPAALVEQGWLTATPVVYEDFLPRSAAGIFHSNLAERAAGSGRDVVREAAAYDREWLSGAVGRTVHDPFALYEAEERRSLDLARTALGLGPAV